MPIGKKLVLLGLLSYVIISANIGGFSIYMLDEAKNSQCAREMAKRGDWIVPTFNDDLRTDKPPLHYFFMRVSYQIFGDGAFGARFFSSVFGVLTVLITFLFARRYSNERAAYFSSFVLLVSLGFVAQFHLAVPDPYLIFFIGASLMAYFVYQSEQNRKFLYLAYVAIGLGVLVKGPIAIVLPGMGVFFFMFYKRKLNFKEILMLNPPLGILIILLVAGPWYYLVHVETDGAWTQGFFLDHNVNRFNAPKEGHSGNFLLPSLYVIGMLLPFSLFLPQAIKRSLKEKSDLLIFCLIALACMVVFFSISSTKLPSYTSPVFPFAAILIGSYISKLDETNRKWFWIPVTLFLIIAIALFFGSKIGIQDAKEIRHLTHLQWYFLPLPIAALIALIFAIKKNRFASIYSMGIGFLILHQVFFYFVFPEINKQNPVIKTMHLLENEEHLIGYHRLNAGYVHALNRIIPNSSKNDELVRFLEGKDHIIIFTRPKYIETISGIAFEEIAREPDLFDGTTTVLLKATAE